MKHVKESLEQFRTYQFFKLFEEDKEDGLGTDKPVLKDKEKEGLDIIDKITKNFEDFKKDAKGEIIKYKEFWEENKQTKKSFTENGDIYKMFDDDYVVGVLELPVETRSDGSIEGGMGATDEPEEEIIEGKTLTEAEESDDEFGDLDLNLDLDSPETGTADQTPAQTPTETPTQTPTEAPAETPEQTPAETPEPTPEVPAEEPDADLTSPQRYLVVYDLSGDEREEIFRCGSNNVVKAFNAFYNDTFKGSMKDIIAKYKQQKEVEKKEAEKTEKKKVETEKEKKVQKFLGKTNESLNERFVLNGEVQNQGGIEKDVIWNYPTQPTPELFSDFVKYLIRNFPKNMYRTEEEIDKLFDKFPNMRDNDEYSEGMNIFKKHYNVQESLNEAVDSSDFESWLDEVEEHLKEEYDLDDREVAVFTSIADDQLNDLFDQGTDPIDAATSVAENEDFWEEFHASKEEEFGDEELEDVDDELEDPTVVYDDEDELSDEDLDDFDEDEELEDEDLDDEGVDTLEDEDEINNLNIRKFNDKTNVRKFRDLEND